ncbi:MAG: hypothetical protein GF411_00510 [Candidatus Lokiarchaeota archaeon]|nr:hypothetical protein [Candidatus Lokiarchaeota archaeon]
MNRLLCHAKALYRDRQKIAVAALVVVFFATIYLLYSPGIYSFAQEPPSWFPDGWTQGIEVVYSFNSVGFFLAFALMVFVYGFWSWAFLPAPAVAYTVKTLKGIFGQSTEIKQKIGKRFRINLDSDKYVDVKCRVQEQSSGEWFVYHLRSSPLNPATLEDVALRHGMTIRNNRFTTWISSDELHHRVMLMVKAMSAV